MRFLLLDDEKVSRFTLSQTVQSIPRAIIEEAENAGQARQCLERLSAPVVCIFDVRLPGESGLELLAWLRKQPRYLAWPVMLFTGNEDSNTREQAAHFRVDGFLPKPPDRQSVGKVAVVAARLAEDLLPEPKNLAQRLGTSHGHLMSYVNALEKKITELTQTASESAWQTELARCRQVATALGSRYLLQTLQKLQSVALDERSEWQAATVLVLGGMRERIEGRY
jgi:CheY-like chemotaxis protein